MCIRDRNNIVRAFFILPPVYQHTPGIDSLIAYIAVSYTHLCEDILVHILKSLISAVVDIYKCRLSHIRVKFICCLLYTSRSNTCTV